MRAAGSLGPSPDRVSVRSRHEGQIVCVIPVPFGAAVTTHLHQAQTTVSTFAAIHELGATGMPRKPGSIPAGNGLFGRLVFQDGAWPNENRVFRLFLYSARSDPERKSTTNRW
jgi:hypothetical protein